jgi:hypothetical protein
MTSERLRPSRASELVDLRLGAMTPVTPTGTRSANESRGCSLGSSSPEGRDGKGAGT